MSIRFLLMLSILPWMFHSATAQPSADLDEHFSWVEPGLLASEDTTHLRSSDAGYVWRGHAAAGTIQAAGDGTLRFKNEGNVEGSYVISSFDVSENALPDLSQYGATFKVFARTAPSEQRLRWLIRTEGDRWYISSPTDNPVPSNAHKGFPPQVYEWRRLASSSEDLLNREYEDPLPALEFGNAAAPDLATVTGFGIYVEQGCGSLIFEWLQLHEHEPLVTYCPAYSSHYVETNSGVRWGFSALGGGSSGEFYVGSDANLNAPGWGRAFQSAFRSRWHNGDYNPTQGGRTKTYGATTPMWYADSESGTRVEYGPFQVATMGRGFDFLTYHDLTNGRIPGGWDDTPGEDDDGLDEEGYTERDEVLTEFWMEGWYEDVSEILSDPSVSALHMYQQYDYRDEPHMILQFGGQAVTEDGSPVLNKSAYKEDISPLLDGKQPSTPVDPAHLLFFWGDRIDRNEASYNWFWWPDEDGEWVSKPLDEEQQWQRPPDDGPRYTLLVSSPDDPEADAIGLYYPDWSRFNRYNIAGIEMETGRTAYEEDRNARLRWRAGWRTTGRWTTAEGCTFSNRFNKRDFGLVLDGVLAPGNGLAGVHERIRFEAFHIVGTPESIARSVDELEQYYCSLSSGSCVDTAVEEMESPEVDVELYPNPVADRLHLRYPPTATRLVVLDVIGQRVLARDLAAGGADTIDVSALAPGLYFITIEVNETAVRRQVVIAR